MASKTKPAAAKRTAILGAWMRPGMGPDDLKTDDCVRRLTFVRNNKDDEAYWRAEGYTLIGLATVTVAVDDEKQIVKAKVDSLKAELQKTRADAEVKCNRIADQIGKLEALEWNGATA